MSGTVEAAGSPAAQVEMSEARYEGTTTVASSVECVPQMPIETE